MALAEHGAGRDRKFPSFLRLATAPRPERTGTETCRREKPRASGDWRAPLRGVSDLPSYSGCRGPDRDRLSLPLFELSDEHHDDRPDLRDAGSGPEYRGGPRGAPGSRVCRLLCRRRLQLCPAEPSLRPGILGGAAGGRPSRRPLRDPPRLSGPPPAGRLPCHRHTRIRRDHPPHPRELEHLFLRTERHLEYPPAGALRRDPVAPRGDRLSLFPHDYPMPLHDFRGEPPA